MNVYVVCMDSYYVRDAQMFDPEGLSERELNETDIFSETLEMHWHDIDATPLSELSKLLVKRMLVAASRTGIGMMQGACLPPKSSEFYCMVNIDAFLD